MRSVGILVVVAAMGLACGGASSGGGPVIGVVETGDFAAGGIDPRDSTCRVGTPAKFVTARGGPGVAVMNIDGMVHRLTLDGSDGTEVAGRTERWSGGRYAITTTWSAARGGGRGGGEGASSRYQVDVTVDGPDGQTRFEDRGVCDGV